MEQETGVAIIMGLGLALQSITLFAFIGLLTVLYKWFVGLFAPHKDTGDSEKKKEEERLATEKRIAEEKRKENEIRQYLKDISK